jgi:glucan phosphoethanolaminetransferase (alkaline phosphatase superfamily)
VLAASIWVEDRIKDWRAASRPTPAPKSPNVLLLVLDTVAASHLSLYGYNRPTSPTIDEHPDVFCHGTSLYQTELHVPLTDSRETQNLADDPKWLAVFERMRQKLNELPNGDVQFRMDRQ